MKRYLYVGTAIAIAVVAVLGAMAARLQWAASTPSRPKKLPAAAVWIWAPSAPLDFSPRGYWLACWVDAARNVDRCKLTDYKGNNPIYEADYSPVTGPNPVPETRLHLKPLECTTDLFVVVGEDFFPIARLEDGTVLVPTQDLGQSRERYAPR